MNHPGDIKIKVCGMREESNIKELAELVPDYMGFIFYPGSSRYAGSMKPEVLLDLPEAIQKVGVFVNDELYRIGDIGRAFGLQILQLHGDETPEYCQSLKEQEFQVIKVFKIGEEGFDFSELNEFKGVVDYFLFDTKGDLHGGNSVAFNWDLLIDYDGNTPFFLSGGIDNPLKGDINKLFAHNLYGLDINSRFETEPANKDISKIREFMKNIKDNLNQ